jgi:ABC-type Fe3+ transport system permease subunit
MWIEIIVLLLSIPVGYLIAYLARDELVQGRKWFKVLMILAVVVGGWFALRKNYTVVLTAAFILIVTFISHWKSYDGVWTRRRKR